MFGIVASLLSLTAPPTVRDCCLGTSIFKINSVNLTPADPKPGESVALNLDYTVPSDVIVTGGQTRYDITYNFLPLAPTIEPLCQNIPCPLGPGTYLNSTYSTWPTGLSGTVNTKITWLDEVGTQLLCIGIVAKV
jgi:hypothetical protein